MTTFGGNDPRLVKLDNFLKREAKRIIEEASFDWADIPGVIANNAVLRLCYEPMRAGLTLQTTLLEIGQIIGLYDDEGKFT